MAFPTMTLFPNGVGTTQWQDAVSAAGTTQATATQLTGQVVNVTTVAAGAGVNIPASFVGAQPIVFNNGANPLLVYPAQGATDTIAGIAATQGVIIAPYSAGYFACTVAGQWQYQADSPTLSKYNTNTATAGTTLTAANITGGAADVVLNLTGTLLGAANAQLPTVASLQAALHGASPGSSYWLRIMNTSAGAFAWTVTTNTGWTLGGTMSVAQNAYRDFIVTFTSLTAATLQAVGGGTV